ncbi:hypothetical protein JOB18_020579 [Solea senegalensis]|uniref:Uncharacterized protein n=1 Tax=Solea senegalensis TaxID=28829 RepID=A0AAV6SU32_SOLSE|nr:hypothetical protein JOB18_020579 [Solea senegalensis]
MEEMLTCRRSPFSQVFGRQGQLMQATVQSLNSLNDQIASFMVTGPKSVEQEKHVFPPSETETLQKSMTLMRHLLVDAQVHETFGTSFMKNAGNEKSMKASGPSSSRIVDPASLPVPAQTGMSRRGKSRTPSVPEMSRESGLELLRERPEEALSPSRPQVLETPESLSDSLYDSLSSCGSQG